MAEPPPKRPRRPDSKQMWDEVDRRTPLPSRERDEPRDRDRRDDRDHRRYRSRSPRDSRGGRDRDRGGRRDDGRDYRGGGKDRDVARGQRRAGGEDAELGMRLAYRSRTNNGQDSRDDRDSGREDRRPRDSARDPRDKPRERSRSRDRQKDSRMVTRSRSPRRERDHGVRKEEDKPKTLKLDDDFTESRTATPPVSFKVQLGAQATSQEVPTPKGQDHDRMEVDGDTTKLSKSAKAKAKAKAKAQELRENDEDEGVIVVDDGLADMEAMMGFGGFGTTHQKKVPGNDVYAVRKEKKTEYRQYMNRVGGFNRPLSPSKD